MSGARNKAKELGYRVQKIDDLRDEEEEHCLAEVGEDRDDCESHSGKVAESVTDKNLRRIPEQTKFPGVNVTDT